MLITFIFFVGVTAGGNLFGNSLPLLNSITGSALIFLTLLWQIPLCLFLAAKWGTYMAILINLVGNIVGIAVFANGELWYSFPYAISSRLICPTLGILPNGLLVPRGQFIIRYKRYSARTTNRFSIVCVSQLPYGTWFQRREAN